MEINTSTLGPIEIDESRIISLVSPLPGIEQGGTKYALLDLNPQSQFKLLQSVGDAHVCFLVGDPAKLMPGYTVSVTDGELNALGLTKGDEAAVLVILTASGDTGATTANMKAPIVINRKTFAASQIILQSPDYSTKTPVTLKKG